MPKHLFGLILLALPAAATAATPPVKDQLLQITQAWVDAIPKGDKSVWERSLTDGAILVDEFGRINGKADSIASLRPFPPGFSGSIELRDARVQQYGDTAMLLVEEYERETVFGQSFVVRYQSLLTFVKQGGAWKIAGYEDVTIPTAPPRLDVAGLDVNDYPGTYSYAPGHSWTVRADHGVLSYTTHPGGTANVLEPIGKDVFMGSDDERNIIIFHRNAQGAVDMLIERRKFNDFHLMRESPATPAR
ncbi:nuclear transport factor 2 family protein [Dyella acidiphila]|uniref:Nuclear transport factor 2 family protein n=1 Tax=Dyella acidiphila TaxID=2775866 RepID=A0ABR9G9M0_9GAMM|nr:nuclear transport factor 2 family protein [Dyella acidiphila]MBE1160704.1 nuclear transport factor 2 family protein [Dyella acidiphila]